MIRDMTLGQYFPGNSVIHKLDPRMKLILVVFYIVILFVMKTALSYALATAATGSAAPGWWWVSAWVVMCSLETWWLLSSMQ